MADDTGGAFSWLDAGQSTLDHLTSNAIDAAGSVVQMKIAAEAQRNAVKPDVTPAPTTSALQARVQSWMTPTVMIAGGAVILLAVVLLMRRRG